MPRLPMWERRTTFYAAAHAAVYTSPIPPQVPKTRAAAPMSSRQTAGGMWQILLKIAR